MVKTRSSPAATTEPPGQEEHPFPVALTTGVTPPPATGRALEDDLGFIVGAQDDPLIPAISGLLKICIDRLSDAIVITETEPIDHPGPRIVWANRVFYERTGYSPAEIIGQSPRILQGPNTDRATLDRIRRALESWKPVRVETLNYRKDGTTFWCEFEIIPIANEKGWFTHWVSVQRDISERKSAEEKLVLAANVFTHSREGVMITDSDGKIVEVNEAFTRITGYSREDALGQNPRLLSSVRQEKSVYASLWQDLLEKGHWSGEVWNQRKNGEVYPESLTISTVRDANGKARQYVAIFADITQRKALEESLSQLAFYDPLTGLPNRRLLEERVSQALLESSRCALYGALMFLDLDNFKLINDLHGHDVGDLLLMEVAKRLTACVREVDTVARLGGDEFVVLLSKLDEQELASTQHARVVAEKIRAALAEPYLLTSLPAGHLVVPGELHCTASIGVVLLGKHEASQTEVMKWADTAMYQAKDAGRNRVQFHEKATAHSLTSPGARHSEKDRPVDLQDKTAAAMVCANRLLANEVHRDPALRQSEAFESIVLNSLNAEIAVVDGTGVILAVNDRWQKFSMENGLVPGQSAPNTGVGSNYFSVCGTDAVGCAGDRLDASSGLRAVLDGRLASFSIDYPCDSPTERRWFAMVVMPLVQGGKNGAVITHTDITARKQDEEKLRLAARVFSDAHEGITITNAEGLIIEVNDAFTRITGYTREEALGRNPRMLQSGRQSRVFYEAMWRGLTEQGHWSGEIWNKRKNGEPILEQISISAMRGVDGSTLQYVAHFTDISERIQAQNKIDALVFYDPLTGLPNRRQLLDHLDQARQTGSRHAGHNALLFVDLDNFKTINETMGHLQGDLLLVQVAQRLKASIRDDTMLARLGSDEFVVILEDLSADLSEAATQAEAVGMQILSAFMADFALDTGAYHGSASIGIAMFDVSVIENSEQPLKRAELAMFQVKAAGRNSLRFFDDQMQAMVSAHATMEAELREAVIQQQFVLHYQPQVMGSRIIGVEALVRWQHPHKGMISPVEFISLAEKTGLILPLGQWVLETACRQLAAWSQQPAMSRLTMAVNVSARQFQQPDFVDSVLATLLRTGAKPKLLKLELTESMLVDDVEAIIRKMGALKAHGVTFSLDDFGTGYSSLSYLKRLPLDQLKIDQSFVRDIVTDADDAVIAKMVVMLAKSMGLSVIAEGVEQQAQADLLAHLGCHAYQGYLFSRPLPLLALEELVLSRLCDPHPVTPGSS